MRTTRDKWFVQAGYLFLRHCMGLVKPEETVVYLLLRTYIWRGKSSRLGNRYESGDLCCTIAQRTIAAQCNISYSQVKRVLARLAARGWIVSERSAQKRVVLGKKGWRKIDQENIYVLGKRSKRSDGKWGEEQYFADQWVLTEIAKLEQSGEFEDYGIVKTDEDSQSTDSSGGATGSS